MKQSKVSKFRFLVTSHGDGEGFLKNLSGNHLSHAGSDEHLAIVGRSSFTTFDCGDDIKLYAKIPDWPVLIEVDSKEKLYFVVETKSMLFTDALRPTEKAKITSGKKHFKVLGKEVEFAVTNAFEDFSGKYV